VEREALSIAQRAGGHTRRDAAGVTLENQPNVRFG
jgi:hypothetical protein